MPMSQLVWSLSKKVPLETSELNDEGELESLLRDNIEILDKSWLVVKNQVRTNAGKYIDILCIDHDGDMVVVELKKDMTPREVTAQVIDYAASVSMMSVEEIAQLYLEFSHGEKTLNEAYKEKFGTVLDEENVNQHVKMIIVASKMDNSTERIIHFLRDTYQVDINILFFSIYKCENQRLIARTWFEEDQEESAPSPVITNSKWNGEYYVSFGDDDNRKWKDAKKYGFISAGGGVWYTKTLELLSPGDRVWVNIPHTGYVGVGIVTEGVRPMKDISFDVDGKLIPVQSLELAERYHLYAPDDSEKAECAVKIRWIKTVEKSQAVKELGFFGNQNTVCRPTAEKWNFTVDRLKRIWNISD